MKFHPKATVVMLSLALAPVVAQAAEFETLGAMHQTTNPVDWHRFRRRVRRPINQAILTKIKLPPGFHIALYAIVPDARHIAVGPQGVVTFVGTRKTKSGR